MSLLVTKDVGPEFVVPNYKHIFNTFNLISQINRSNEIYRYCTEFDWLKVRLHFTEEPPLSKFRT
jgi:hypothetical protein